jgi:hypothetical protein
LLANLAWQLAAKDSVADGELVQRTARKLTYLRQPDTPLPRKRAAAMCAIFAKPSTTPSGVRPGIGTRRFNLSCLTETILDEL